MAITCVTKPRTACLPSQNNSQKVFQCIMPETGASGTLIVEEPQFRALRLLDPSITFDESIEGYHRIIFDKGETVSLGTARVDTTIGMIEFQILPTNTPFSLCIKNIDNLYVKSDNIQNVLIKDNGEIVPTVRKWGHPWIFLRLQHAKTLAWCHLTDSQLHCLH